jgi:putative ubiquitin-RnfH superfamily antitoxin RatB of RatAB toxin-antitoxin module
MDRKKKYDDKFIKKTIRFTPDEFEKVEIERAKTNLDFTNFCKSAILKKKVKTKDEENFNRDLIYQVNKIGINLNQIARAVNQKDRVAVLTELVEIEKQLRELRNGS